MEAIRVLVVDDHALVRNALIEALNLEEDIVVVGQASDGEEAIGKVRELSPDIVLMDVRMPKLGGLEATRCVKRHFPGVRVILLSAYNERHRARLAGKIGASGYISKNRPVVEIVGLIRRVYKH